MRLLRDAMTLFRLESYPTAFQLAVLSMEEFAKAKWVDHAYYSSITNTGFAPEEYEQTWLRALYSHTEKQSAFIGREYYQYSPKLLKAIDSGNLDAEKQAATYVGLPRRGKRVNVEARISSPLSFSLADAKRMISLVAREFRDICLLIQKTESYFGIPELDEILQTHEVSFIFKWPHRSGLKSKKYHFAHDL